MSIKVIEDLFPDEPVASLFLMVACAATGSVRHKLCSITAMSTEIRDHSSFVAENSSLTDLAKLESLRTWIASMASPFPH